MGHRQSPFTKVIGGTFTMGDDHGDFSIDSKPSHPVRIRDFSISRYLVTQEEWLLITGSNPSNFGGKSSPVEMITWLDAIHFCNQLSRKEGLTPCYEIHGNAVRWNVKSHGFRLPTEAEWEYAARSGGTDFYPYSGDDDLDEVGWYKGNSGGSTHGIGLKKPNRLGIHDMSGNVWEWCWDWFGKYEEGFADNPTGPETGADKVARGGSWLDFAYGCEVGIRSRRKPSIRQSDVGLRLAKALP